jgi:hypothetical protein|tara:strand:+ start:38 stop:199 length:162 start_codon:yes stop_codon:yes gene_type:complete
MAKKLTRNKAKKILKDGSVRGKKLSKRQRGMLGAVASGKRVRTRKRKKAKRAY